MRSKPTALAFVIGVAALLLAAVLLWIAMTILVKVFGIAIGSIHLIVAAIGILSCILSPRQKTNVKLLWIIVIVLAPILGTLLWFLWGKRNT